MNHIILIGRLTRDPELRHTQSSTAVANFSIAVDRGFKNANGEKETDFINCTAWRKTAELIAQYCTKGKQVAVSGAMQSRKYQDKEGNNRTIYEVLVDNIQFLGSATNTQNTTTDNDNDNTPYDNQTPPPSNEGDLPF